MHSLHLKTGLIVLFTLLWMGLFGSPNAQAAPVPPPPLNNFVDFNVNPASFDVIQGGGGQATITFTLSMRSPYSISVLDIETRPLEQFVRGDREDAVINTRITGGTGRRGLILAPGANCTFVETFGSVDSRMPDPDRDFGLWTIRTAISFAQVGNPLNSFGYDPSYQVRVFDPGAPGAPGAAAASPEPSSLALLGTGTLGLFGYGWRRRKQIA